MSWTDHFPILTDSILPRGNPSVTLQDRVSGRAAGQLEIGREAGFPRSRDDTSCHIISTSATWLNLCHNDEPEIDGDAAARLLSEGVAPGHKMGGRQPGARAWLRQAGAVAHELSQRTTPAVLRLHLGPELSPWAEPLASAGCEVKIMARAAAFAPCSGLWRLLALEEERLVTVLAPGLLHEAIRRIRVTEAVAESGLGFWREPGLTRNYRHDICGYRPIPNSILGGHGGIPVRELLVLMDLEQMEGRLRPEIRSANGLSKPIPGGMWPQYGYDEWFLMAAVYPIAARRGLMTLTGARRVPPMILALDVEYATWANPGAVVVPDGLGADWKPAVTRQRPLPQPPLLPVNQTDVIPVAELTHTHPLPGHAWRGEVLHGVTFSETVVSHFNPASILYRGKRWLAYRTECLPFWKWGLVSLARLTENYAVVEGSNRLLRLPTAFGDWCAEDPRLFIHNGTLFLYYTDNWTGGLAKLDEKGRVVSAALFPRVAWGRRPDRDRHDKNWGFFSRNGRLYAVYWTCPHTVREVDLTEWEFGQEWRLTWRPPANVPARLHGGCSPVFHEGLFWRTVHHHESPEDEPDGRRYVVWLMAFDPDPPFRPRLFCTKPVLSGDRVRETYIEGWRPWQVVFCSSMERDRDGWRFFFGHNDRRMRHGRIPDSDVVPYLVQIQEEPDGR